MILRGDAFNISLKNKSIHCVITSPPYWGLRDYGVSGQLGLEKTPEEYVEKMVMVFREVWRVLRNDGTLWLNMGDSYSSGGRGSYDDQGSNLPVHVSKYRPQMPHGLKPKDLCGIPWRLAFALQNDGWYLRSDIIWTKPNPMPESVSGCAWKRHRIKIGHNPNDRASTLGGTSEVERGPGNCSHDPGTKGKTIWIDCPGCPKCSPNDGYVLSWNAGRPTKAHEYIFLLTKSPKYFFDADAVREPHIDPKFIDAEKYGTLGEHNKFSSKEGNRSVKFGTEWSPKERAYNPAGRNIRTVWSAPKQKWKLRSDLSDDDRAYVLAEIARRGLVANKIDSTGD